MSTEDKQSSVRMGVHAINCIRTDSGAINRFMGYYDKKHTLLIMSKLTKIHFSLTKRG